MKNLIAFIFLLISFSGCKLFPTDANPKTEEVKLSQFEKASYCDLMIAKDGTDHAVFLEKPDFGKPAESNYK